MVGAASLAPAAAVAAASGGGCDGGGGWDPTGLLPPVSEWQQVQVAMAQLLVKVQVGHGVCIGRGEQARRSAAEGPSCNANLQVVQSKALLK